MNPYIWLMFSGFALMLAGLTLILAGVHGERALARIKRIAEARGEDDAPPA